MYIEKVLEKNDIRSALLESLWKPEDYDYTASLANDIKRLLDKRSEVKKITKIIQSNKTIINIITDDEDLYSITIEKK